MLWKHLEKYKNIPIDQKKKDGKDVRQRHYCSINDKRRYYLPDEKSLKAKGKINKL